MLEDCLKLRDATSKHPKNKPVVMARQFHQPGCFWSKVSPRTKAPVPPQTPHELPRDAALGDPEFWYAYLLTPNLPATGLQEN